MAKVSSAHKILITLATLAVCEFLRPTLCIPVIIKSSISVNKPLPQHYKTTRPSSQNNILSKLKYTINAGNKLQNEDTLNKPYMFSENNILPATPTTLKLKNAIRVLGYVGNKQIIPIAQQRQASVSLPFDVVVTRKTKVG